MDQHTQEKSQAGWTVGQSIALELDMALTYVSGKFVSIGLSEDFTSVVRSLPPAWLAEAPEYLGEESGWSSMLEMASDLAGTLAEPDFSRMSLAVRSLTVEDALNGLVRRAAIFHLEPDSALPLPERLADLVVRLEMASYQNLGVRLTRKQTHASLIHREMEKVLAILQGGRLHDRFWHWLDRFYFEFYRPWRESRFSFMEERQRKAAVMLGALQNTGAPPPLGWLPPQNSILRYPEMKEAILNGRMGVFFWVEPFGMSDSWVIQPDRVIVSFAEPGAIIQNFLAYTGDVAARAQALADPTRLIILRMIRYSSMINTEIAAYLNLSRPTVSIHAKILRDAGLIRSYPDGRAVRHEIVASEVHRLFHDLDRLLDLPPDEPEKGSPPPAPEE